MTDRDVARIVWLAAAVVAFGIVFAVVMFRF